MQIRVEVSSHRSARAAKAGARPGSVCCVVGATPALGQWDPKKSPKLQTVDDMVWEGSLAGGSWKPGEEFKYCILNEAHNEYVWEEQGPMHVFPALETSLRHEFENAAADRAEGHPQIWEITGGADKGGIIVRAEKDLTSAEAGRLGTGSLVEEVELDGERLKFRRKTGSGPSTGWISVQLKGKALAVKTSLAPPGAKPIQSSTSGKQSSEVLLRVKVSNKRSPLAAEAGLSDGAVCCVVGEAPAFGAWDPKKSPKLAQKRIFEKYTVWEGLLDTRSMKPNQEYKYCILDLAANVYVWEESCPMHVVPGTSEASHEFEDGAAAAHDSQAELWPPPKEAPVSSFDEVDLETLLVQHWIPWGSSVVGPSVAPRSIFHAFHWPFSTVKDRLQELRDLGFSAVQISPAQKSKSGREWWARYQPQDYLQIEGLGSLDDLRSLCLHAKELGLMIIGDAVFNHMLVVASGHDWERAQSDEKQLKLLQQRLAEAVRPSLEVEDFQWPWFNMSGPHWDNENRYEGWGNGEWSELRYCPKVISVQQKHLQLLLDAGVTGFRFDAVKHMRPEHVGEHIRFLRQSSKGAFAYGEVLGVDDSMHQEYMDPLQMPSTDFPLTVYINEVLKSGVSVAKAGPRAAVAKVAKSEGVDVQDSGSPSAAAPGLSGDSIRFARNHDTVMNPGSFYGLSGSCRSSRIAWVWLLAVHDGSVLVYPEDMLNEESGPLLRRALTFRASVEQAAATEICLQYSKTGGPPKLLTVLLRDGAGKICGICVANLLERQTLRVASLPLKEALPVKEVKVNSKVLKVHSDGSLTNSSSTPEVLVIRPWDAMFFVAEQASVS